MLVTGKEMLDKAHKEKYAVGAFNVNNMEALQAVIEAAEEEKSPVIIQTSEGALKYAGLELLAEMIKTAGRKASIPVVINLDHGTTYETIVQCIKAGYTSVMIDGSGYPLDENIAVTNEIIKIAHAAGISVEAELGRLGGIEDNIQVDERDARFTHPDEAEVFVDKTGVDYLAIAIGTAHGKYKGEPKLDFERLDTIKKRINIPVVLHGASGISEDAIKKAINLGVNKINIDTDLRLAFTEAIRSIIINKPEEFDPRKVCGPAKDAIKKVVKEKIRLFGSANKA